MARRGGARRASVQDAVPSAVAGRVRSGLTWSLVNNVVIRLAGLASSIALARILAPEDFGVYAIASTVLVLLESANELGVSLALVQRPGDVREIASTVMTIALASSFVLYGVTYALAPAIAAWTSSPEAVSVIRVMCLVVVIDGVRTVPIGLLNRLFLQKRLLVGEGAGFAVTTSVTILMALNGMGAMSFAWGNLIGAVVGTVVHLALAPIRVWPGWNRDVVRPLLRTGFPLAGASLLVLSVVNVDNLVVGSVLGQAMLGYYMLAFRQSSWPLVLFSEPARRVALAGFSRLADDPDRLPRAFARGSGLLVAATAPACVLLATCAGPLIRTLYGERWEPAAQVLPVLALLGLLRVFFFVGYDLLVAVGRPGALVGVQFVWLITLVPGLYLGANADGIRGTGVAHVLVAGLVVAPLFLLVLQRRGVAPARALAACGRPLLGALLLALVTSALNAWVSNDLMRLLLAGVSVLVVYAPVVWPMRVLLPSPRGQKCRPPTA